MRKIRKMADDANDSCRNAETKLSLGEAKSAVAELEIAMDNNDKRATEVGPVLEEILHARWNHWGPYE
jgi:hypothetical protein